MFWKSTRWVFVALAAMAASGCAFPKPEPLKGDPFQYSNAFQSAATEAVVAKLTGRGFYEHFEGPGYGLYEVELCTRAGLQTFLEGRRRCGLFEPRSSPDCQNTSQCMQWAIDPSISRDPELWAAITAALELPCAHLTNPADIPKAYRAYPYSHPRQSFGLLNCQGGGLIAEAIDLSSDGAILRARFVKRPGGWFARPAYRGRGRTLGA